MSINIMRIIGAASFIAVVCGIYWYVDHNGYERGKKEVQSAWDSEKSKRMVASAIQSAESREKERIADEKSRIAQLSYAKARADLSAAIADLRNQRLCGDEDMPGRRSVRVADSGSSSMPRTAEGSAGAGESSSTTAGAGQDITVGDALADTLQCSRLIDWVRSQDLAR